MGAKPYKPVEALRKVSTGSTRTDISSSKRPTQKQGLQQRPGYQRAMAAHLRAAEEQAMPDTPATDTRP